MRQYQEIAFLIKRTTPKKKFGRRIVGTMLSYEFLNKHPVYFAENHVNLIKSNNKNTLFGLAGWLNSRLANFLFSMMNGSSHLSVYELERFPMPKELIVELSSLAMKLYCGEQSQNIQRQIDEKTFDYFNLTQQEQARVKELIQG